MLLPPTASEIELWLQWQAPRSKAPTLHWTRKLGPPPPPRNILYQTPVGEPNTEHTYVHTFSSTLMQIQITCRAIVDCRLVVQLQEQTCIVTQL